MTDQKKKEKSSLKKEDVKKLNNFLNNWMTELENTVKRGSINMTNRRVLLK